MTETTAAQTDVKGAIDALIKAGTTGDLDALDELYHDDMRIRMIDTDDNLVSFKKPALIEMLKGIVGRGGAPASSWANFHEIQTDGDQAHVLITRKIKFDNDDRILVLSIDLKNSDAGWQVTREVIFNRPNPEPTPA